MSKFLSKQLPILFIILCLHSISCRKFVEIDPPPTQVTSSIVFDNPATAEAAVMGIYNRLQSGGALINLCINAGLSADEFEAYGSGSTYKKFESNSLLAAENPGSPIWNEAYFVIFTANTVIEGLANSHHISQDVKTRLIAEVKFFRAFCNFYLVNLFGDVPLNRTTDYKINSFSKRMPDDSIYNFIVQDLKDGSNDLPEDFSQLHGERNRATKWSAKALLARVYLSQENWTNAEELATDIINNSSIFSLVASNNIFLKNSEEAILQFSPLNVQFLNTLLGNEFILFSAPGPNDVSLTDNLRQDFELGDKRLNWIGNYSNGTETYYFPFKYKVSTLVTPDVPVSEYLMVLRLAELYLIRAEARAQQNNIVGAVDDLNVLRQRSRAEATTAIPDPVPDLNNNLTQDQALIAVDHERRIELFAEWGDRWITLKRRKIIGDVLSALKGSNWSAMDSLYPIPESEININPHLRQNPGY